MDKKTQQQFQKTLQPQQPRSNPKLGKDNNPKLTMKTMETLHSPKTGEKSDSQTWTKEKHKHRPPSLRGTSVNLHIAPNARDHSHEIMDGKTCFPTHCVSPKTKESILREKNHAHFPPMRKESEQNDSLCEEEQNNDEKPKQTPVIQKWGNPFFVQAGGIS